MLDLNDIVVFARVVEAGSLPLPRACWECPRRRSAAASPRSSVRSGSVQHADYNDITCSLWYIHAAVQHNP
jgi:hypothetical protein